MPSGFASNHRVTLLAGLVLAGFGAVGARLVQLHVLDRPARLAELNQARHELVVVPARRGDILDARGDTLATSRTKVALAVDPWAIDDLLKAEKKPARRARILAVEQEKRVRLAELLGLPAAEVEKYFALATRDARPGDDPRRLTEDGRAKIRWVKFNEGVEESVYARLTDGKLYPQLEKNTPVPTPPAGLVGSRYGVRTYPHGQLAAHVVGFINREETPVTGVEKFLNFYLHGADGWRETEKDGRQRELAQFRAREVAPTDGLSVVLSIDSAVQRMAEAELARIAETFRPEKATIIISEARTGFLLALANWPTFDLNHYNNPGPAGEAAWRNTAVADRFEPGSTFKIVASAGALNEGLVTPRSEFDCSLDQIIYRGKVRSLPKDDHDFTHPLTVAEIITRSSNRGAAQLGMLLGEERLWNYAHAFGFAELSGFGAIYPESPGVLAHWKKWSGSDITRIPMGHTVDATPLQIHMAMGVIASGGLLLRPQLVREVRDAAGATAHRFGPVVRSRAVSEATARTMARMLMGVASGEGTAPEAAIANYQVAGKTGTTQKLIVVGKNPDGSDKMGYSSRNHVGSFVGFFPADRPEVVISVIVDDGHPPGGGAAYGRVVAVPGFRHLSEQLIPYLDIRPAGGLSAVPGLLALEGGRP
jgi:cell division protein FtsI/penicillin-binding protein 2